MAPHLDRHEAWNTYKNISMCILCVHITATCITGDWLVEWEKRKAQISVRKGRHWGFHFKGERTDQ